MLRGASSNMEHIQQHHRSTAAVASHCTQLCHFVEAHAFLCDFNIAGRFFSAGMWAALPIEWRSALDLLSDAEVDRFTQHLELPHTAVAEAFTCGASAADTAEPGAIGQAAELSPDGQAPCCGSEGSVTSVGTFLAAAARLALARKPVLPVPPAHTACSKHPSELAGMNPKKIHEVFGMAYAIWCQAKESRVDWVVDLGSGKGYLSEVLSYHYGLKVVAIDSNKTNTEGAVKRKVRSVRLSLAW